MISSACLTPGTNTANCSNKSRPEGRPSRSQNRDKRRHQSEERHRPPSAATMLQHACPQPGSQPVVSWSMPPGAMAAPLVGVSSSISARSHVPPFRFADCMARILCARMSMACASSFLFMQSMT